MKKQRLKLAELKVKSFSTTETSSIKAGFQGIDDDIPPSEETIDTWNAGGCNSAIEFNCQFTQNNQVGCV